MPANVGTIADMKAMMMQSLKTYEEKPNNLAGTFDGMKGSPRQQPRASMANEQTGEPVNFGLKKAQSPMARKTVAVTLTGARAGSAGRR